MAWQGKDQRFEITCKTVDSGNDIVISDCHISAWFKSIQSMQNYSIGRNWILNNCTKYHFENLAIIVYLDSSLKTSFVFNLYTQSILDNNLCHYSTRYDHYSDKARCASKNNKVRVNKGKIASSVKSIILKNFANSFEILNDPVDLKQFNLTHEKMDFIVKLSLEFDVLEEFFLFNNIPCRNRSACRRVPIGRMSLTYMNTVAVAVDLDGLQICTGTFLYVDYVDRESESVHDSARLTPDKHSPLSCGHYGYAAQSALVS
ncbi:hypothetical protein RF11_00779 [Thelohanellus kitauei]|uniref:Uncharacterized protein n=1 Tax=Thelohanellus kitauei TaxID=669202 RepID=A0A0C2N6S5_THEKT|nr:hypothetical protein RF11_00779 [Thelohanellus kitauei]